MTKYQRNNFQWPVHLGQEEDSHCIYNRTMETQGQFASSLACKKDEKHDDNLNHSTELPPRPINLNIRRKSPAKHTSPKKYQRNNGTTTLKRRPRVENKMPPINQANFDENELMRQETKLLVLEYLSSLPTEKIRARNKRESSQVVKARTIHSSERPFIDVIEKRKSSSSSLRRRNSEQYDEKVREKLRNMADPLRKRLSPAPEVLHDITKFDKSQLRHCSGNSDRRRSHRLSILRFSTQECRHCPETPITLVTTHLEEMSEDIMKDYPQLLDEHVTELLTPLDSGEKLTYEDFSVVAKSVFEKQLARFTGSIWTKVAMVFYLVKEVVLSGGLSDIQVEDLVDYATRFISEHSLEPIKKEGGWAALELQDDELITAQDLRGNIYDPLGDDSEMDFVDGPPQGGQRSRENSTEDNTETFSYTGVIKDAVNTWTTYGAAALAIGIGVAYSYMKQQ